MPPTTTGVDSDEDSNNSVRLAQIKTDEQIQKWKFDVQRMRIRWVSFTGAILLAIIGAVGGWQSGWFKFTLEKDASDNQQFTDKSRIERDYLDRYMKHALNEDLQYRSDFALYVSKTAITYKVRANWRNYHTAIQELLEREQSKLSVKATEVDQLKKDEAGNSAKIAALEAEIRALNTRIQGSSIQRNKNSANKFVPPGALQRNPNLDVLHPTFRAKLVNLLSKLNEEGHKFEIFEGYRTPFRQEQLYEKGRTIPGQRVSNARAWQTTHNFGLAADLVLKIDGKWSWRTDGQYANSWKRLHELARGEGLEPLSYERPHVQLVQFPVSKLFIGSYPDGGDVAWSINLTANIEQWRQFRNSPAPVMPAETTSMRQ